MRPPDMTSVSPLLTVSLAFLALQVCTSTPAARTSTTPRPLKDSRHRLHADADSYRPRNVSVQVINSTAIRIQWDYPRAATPAMGGGYSASPMLIEGVRGGPQAAKNFTEQTGCPISQYTIRLKSDAGTVLAIRHSGSRAGRGRSSTRTSKVDGTRRSVTLNDLTPNTSYYVRVLATACDGTRGKPSPWIGLRTGAATAGVVLGSTGPLASSLETGSRRLNDDEDDTYDEEDDDDNADDGEMGDRAVSDETDTAVPGKPTYVRTRTFSDSVMVSWLPPDDGSVVRGYMVGYGEGVPDVNWQYVDATRSNVTIKNLKAATQYIVSLRAFNNRGKGPVIYDLIYTRDVSGPTMSPPNELTSKILSSTTLWLQWVDPTLSSSQQPTDNRYYNIHYRALAGTSSSWAGDSAAVAGSSSGTNWAGLGTKTLSLIVKEQHVVFYDLHPGTRYEFKVRTVKDAVASVFSEPIVNKTFETAPSSPPRNVVVMATNQSGTVRVTWKPPRLPNGDITGYLVLFTQNPDLPVERWQTQQVVGTETETVIGSLHLGASYHFRIQAVNSAGSSPTSSNVVFYAIPYRSAAALQSQSPSPVTSSPSVATAVSSMPDHPMAQDSDVTVSPAVDADAGIEHGKKGDLEIADEQGDEYVRAAPFDVGSAQNLQQMDAAGSESTTARPSTVVAVLSSTSASHHPPMAYRDAIIKLTPTASSATGSGDKSLKQRGSASKAKRQPDDLPASASLEAKSYFDVPSIADKPQSADRKTVKPKPLTTTASELVKFQVMISHQVSAYITWPEIARCNGAGGEPVNSKRVIGYQLRYYSGEATVTSGGGVATTPTVLNLTSNVALIDNLRPNIEYWYQLKYVFDDGTDSGWSQQQLIDTR